MSVSIRVPTVLRKHTGGEKVIESQGATIKELILNLERSHAELAGAVTGDDGTLAGFVNVYLNDEDIRYLGGPDAELRDGDEVSILPAVAGG